MSKFAQHIVHTCTLYWLGAKRRIIPLAGGNDSSQEQDNLSNSSGQEIQPNLQVQEKQPNSYGLSMLSQVWNTTNTQKYCICFSNN